MTTCAFAVYQSLKKFYDYAKVEANQHYKGQQQFLDGWDVSTSTYVLKQQRNLQNVLNVFFIKDQDLTFDERLGYSCSFWVKVAPEADTVRSTPLCVTYKKTYTNQLVS